MSQEAEDSFSLFRISFVLGCHSEQGFLVLRGNSLLKLLLFQLRTLDGFSEIRHFLSLELQVLLDLGHLFFCLLLIEFELLA